MKKIEKDKKKEKDYISSKKTYKKGTESKRFLSHVILSKT